MILRIVLAIIFIPVLIIFIFLAFNFLPLPGDLVEIKDLLAALTTLVFMLFYLIAVLLYLFLFIRKALSRFDTEAYNKGLKTGRSSFMGRQYKGKIDGLDIKIDYFPQRGIHREMLDLYISKAPGIDFTISKKIPLLVDVDQKKIDSGVYEIFDGYNIYSSETLKVKKILEDRDIINEINSLLKLFDGCLVQIYVKHKIVHSRIRGSGLSKDLFIVSIEKTISIAREIQRFQD